MTTFLTDRDLGKRFGAILAEAGFAVERHDEHFKPDAADERWLRTAGEREWFVLTHDRRIRYKPNERDAVMLAGVGMFVLIGDVPTRELARSFVNSRLLIDRFIEQHERPFIAKVYRPAQSELDRNPDSAGRVDVWLTKKQWRRRKGSR